MKKSILFCCYGIGIGGIEKCMISLLNALDTTKYDIDVLPMNPEYDLLDSIRADVSILDPFDYVMNTTDTVAGLKERKANLSRYVKYVAFRLINKWGKKPWKLFNAPDKIYDIAIAYAHIGYVPYYVLDCIKAHKKYMWHHEGRYIKDKRYFLDKEYYPFFDAIIAVSKDDREVLVEVFPNLKNKFKVLYNIIDRKEIRTKALENVRYSSDKDVLKITTVGRLTQQKGPDIMIQVAKKLRTSGVNFIWYWIGDGDKADYLKNEVLANNLLEHVVMMGNQKNPYPYIAQCDIYVQPSYYEAYCTTTIEAQILEKPIVVTDVCGMREQFTSGVNGILVPIDAGAIYNAIIELINNPARCNQLSENLHQKMQKSDNLLEEYYKLFDT